MLTSFRRIIRSGFIGMWRSAYVSLAAIFVMTITLFVIGSTLMLDQLLTTSLQQLQSRVDINLYFVPEASQEDIDSLRTDLAALPSVQSVEYTSRDEALEQYRETNQGDSVALQALEELEENPLGATLAIQAQDTSQYEGIAQFLSERQSQANTQNPVIDEVNYYQNEQSINRLTAIIGAVEQASFITMLVLILAAVLITFNTIRLAIYTSREEISVMRLVGAGNMFIRGPFMLQGMLYGVISGVLAILIMYPVLLWLGPKTETFFGLNLLAYFISDLGFIMMVLVGIGVVLGLISSLLATARYLRV